MTSSDMGAWMSLTHPSPPNFLSLAESKQECITMVAMDDEAQGNAYWHTLTRMASAR